MTIQSTTPGSLNATQQIHEILEYMHLTLLAAWGQPVLRIVLGLFVLAAAWSVFKLTLRVAKH